MSNPTIILCELGESILTVLKAIPGPAVAALAIINGVMLFRYYWRDRPKLKLRSVLEDDALWWCFLPDGDYEGQPTHRYGFLAYLSVLNSGLRPVALCSWPLMMTLRMGRNVRLPARSISRVERPLPGTETMKVYPVLGQGDSFWKLNSRVDPGDSISGFAYYVGEFWGAEDFNPKIEDDSITGRVVVEDVFGKKTSAEFRFTRIELEDMKKWVREAEVMP